MTPDRDLAPSTADASEDDLLFRDLKTEAFTRDERAPYRLSVKQLGIGVCIAIAAGAAFAFWTRPVPPPPPDNPFVSATRAAAPPAPLPRPAGESAAAKSAAPRTFAMNVRGSPLPPTAGAPAKNAERSPAAPAAMSDRPAPRPASSAPAAHREPPSRIVAEAGAPPDTAYLDEDDGPSFDCRFARSASERMVCNDPGLALADRVLEQSYEMALAAGVPGRWLRAEQEDWRAIRESAARHSRDAVADVYAQRIDELRAMAEEPVE